VRALELRHRKHEPETVRNDLAERDVGAKVGGRVRVTPADRPIDGSHLARDLAHERRTCQ
jgi:hypothetical protein